MLLYHGLGTVALRDENILCLLFTTITFDLNMSMNQTEA